MSSRNFEQARQYAIRRLEQELSPRLLYHGLAHTRDEVVPAAAWLAELEGVRGDTLELLLTAAWFHDLGYIEQSTNHEVIGVRIAAEVLVGFGYTPAEIESVGDAILATILPHQQPATLVAEIMADADLSVLGRANFLSRNADLRRELALLGKVFSDRAWYTGQVALLESHRYYTASARAHLNAQKAANLLIVQEKLAALPIDD